ncbi:MAG: PKD domain-containing protein [Chitinophagales bacterium]|nr:PKD domain-containing protein [Chitinophagales bacterium]MDW8273156.1 PKD domain-containing protein [Chitinophagales bacterium]
MKTRLTYLRTLIGFITIVMLGREVQSQYICGADFLWNVNQNNGTVNFLDYSFVTPGYTTQSWSWNFGDGSTSTLKNPTKTYSRPGTYTVCLKIVTKDSANNFCIDSVCHLVTWHCQNNIQGSWNYSINGNTVSFTANYNSNSMPVSYLWKFTNTDSSTQKNPVFTFPGPGNYNVCLRVKDNFGCFRTECKTISISPPHQGCNLKADFYYSFYNPAIITLFSNDSFFPPGSSITNTWYIGNNQIASCNGAECSADFYTVGYGGNHTICMVAKVNGYNCADTICKTINLSCPISAYFNYADSGNLKVGFFPSALTNNYFFWDFGDGNTSTLPYTSHTYAAPGTYTVCLRVAFLNNPGCADTFCRTITVTGNNSGCGLSAIIYQTLNQQNQVVLEAIPTGGCLPMKYRWSTGDSSNYVIVPPQFYNTTYAVTVTDCNGCTAVASTIVSPPVNSQLCGLVFFDDNGNYLMDSIENGMRARITISRPGSVTHVFSDSITGFWQAQVQPGTYTVCVSLVNNNQQGLISTFPFGSPNNNTSQPPGCYTITIGPNQTICDLNFGFKNNKAQICGYVYLDLNNNNVKDSTEPAVAGQRVYLGSQSVFSNSAGYYVFFVAPGTHTITFTPSSPFQGYASNPASYTINATSIGQSYCNNNFGIQVPSGQCDAAVDISPISTVTPGFNAYYTIRVYNLNGVATGGLLTFNFEPGLIFLSATPPPASYSNSSATVTWNINNILPGTYKTFNVKFITPTNFQLGKPVFSFAEFTSNGNCTEATLANNIDTTHQTVVGSYDPNDKHVSPEGNIPNNEQELVYTIRFQNTGTAPAVNVVIHDTLHPQLNWNTFRVKSFSHSCNVVREGAFVSFVFNNIMLPDSNTNEPESHGYVSYAIKAKPNLPNGTLITNRAAIYFDFNEPVITNTTINRIFIPLNITDVNGRQPTIIVAPNPFREHINILIKDEIKEAVNIIIRDVTGRVIHESVSHSSLTRIELPNIQNGIYLYEVKRGEQLIGHGKLIAK